MESKKSAIIVGAGAGGIATAAFLAGKGYRVRIFEKNAFPGGRCGQIIRDGHRFDIGATILLMPNLYREVFNSLNLNFDNFLHRDSVDVLYKLFFENGSELDITTDPAKMEFQLEAIEKGSYNKLQDYISKGYRLYELSFRKLLGRNFYHAAEFINLSNLFLLFKLKAFTNHNTYVRKYFKHPHLRTAFTFQNIYVGQSPYTAPALFSMLPAIELNEGSCFVKGGMFGVITELLKTAGNLGVEFIYNSQARKINVTGGIADSVSFEDGTEASADIIVANADLPYVYRDLLPDEKISRRIDKMNYSCSAFVYHWGLDKTYPKLGLHNVVLSADYRENLSRIFDYKSLGDKPDFYIYAPSRCDENAAPEGGDTLSVIVPAGHVDPALNQDWDSTEKKARNHVISRLKQMGMADIEDHIKFEISLQPVSWEKQLNVSRGGVFGSLGHNIMQMGYFRPHNRHDKYRNLYFVGGSTHPGSGVPLVLLSAKLVAERIINEN